VGVIAPRDGGGFTESHKNGLILGPGELDEGNNPALFAKTGKEMTQKNFALRGGGIHGSYEVPTAQSGPVSCRGVQVPFPLNPLRKESCRGGEKREARNGERKKGSQSGQRKREK